LLRSSETVAAEPEVPMPRKTRKSPAPPAPLSLDERRDAAIAALPFAPDREPTDPRNFDSLPEDVQVAIVAEMLLDFRVRKIGGDAMRGKYAGASEAHKHGRGLTGPRRRAIFEQFGKRAEGVGKSYVAFRSGAPRVGTNAKGEGEGAARRAADAMRELADAKVTALDAKGCRALLRSLDADAKVPTVRKGDESALRAATVAAVLASGSVA
jgi:hypothetical protein